MPNKYQRPPSSHPLSHFSANNPAKNEQKPPNSPGIIADANPAPPLTCSAFISLSNSSPSTAGVSNTASAKLNSSARILDTPASIPVEIVAPDRENPRNGRQK